MYHSANTISITFMTVEHSGDYKAYCAVQPQVLRVCALRTLCVLHWVTCDNHSASCVQVRSVVGLGRWGAHGVIRPHWQCSHSHYSGLLAFLL